MINKCDFKNGYEHGKSLGVNTTWDVHDALHCVSLVTLIHPSANAATYEEKNHTCLAVFNATGRIIEDNKHKTCLVGRKLFLGFLGQKSEILI